MEYWKLTSFRGVQLTARTYFALRATKVIYNYAHAMTSVALAKEVSEQLRHAIA